MKHLATLFTIAVCGATAAGDELTVPELTTDQLNAVEEITEGRVLSAVSFLASDELAGRNTPSPELTIATSYVAARFRGAGLQPLGADGSYYQVHEIATTQPPRQIATLRNADGQNIPCLGVLCGGPGAISLTGPVIEATASSTGTEDAIVRIDDPDLPPRTADSPAHILALISRQLRALQDGMPGVLLIACDSDSTLLTAAERLRERPFTFREGLLPQCAVVLIEKDTVNADAEVTVQVDAQQMIHTPVRNVVGVLRGSDPEVADEAILVSAHLDHIGRLSRGTDRINNGADDNATGVTAVLSMADAGASLQVSRPRRSIVFLTFWGEEKGLRGSKEFVKAPLWPLEKVVANINIEMVGRPEEDAREKAWMTGWSHSNLGVMMNAGAQRVGVEIFNRTDVGEMLYSRSDNYPFVQQDVIAHSFSAGSLHADYHQPSDEWEKLDIPHMTKVIRGLFAGVLLIADSPVVPQAN